MLDNVFSNHYLVLYVDDTRESKSFQNQTKEIETNIRGDESWLFSLKSYK